MGKSNISLLGKNTIFKIFGNSNINQAWESIITESERYNDLVENLKEETKRLMEISEKSLFIGLEQVKPGNRISDIGHAIQTYLESNGYGVPRDYTGHGVGKDIHEDPIIPNYGIPNRGPKIAKGMVFAIEPMVTLGDYYTRTLFDDWTVKTADHRLSCHFEHTIAITEDGYEILTKLKENVD